MAEENLTWYPLYWVYNDFWKWTYSEPIGNNKVKTYPVEHAGHVHFFMPDFPIKDATTQQAYFGEQKYTFELVNEWGSDTNGENIQDNIRVIGRPKWYFYIAEYWRRIYLQDWDYPENALLEKDAVVGKKGIKYEASKDCHSRGPYREGKDNYFFSTKVNRTLPIEYWKNHEKTIRDHYLRHGEDIEASQQYVWDFGEIDENGEVNPDKPGSYPQRKKDADGNVIPIPLPPPPPENSNSTEESDSFEESNSFTGELAPIIYPWSNYFENFDDWTIPRGEYCKGDAVSKKFPGTASYTEEDKARWNYPDKHFISPIIEYQKVIHSKTGNDNWGRYAGWEERDVDRELDEDGIETGEDFGDDWKVEITIPFKKNDMIQSPFSDDSGKVYPVGVYCHNLDKEGKIKPLKYNKKIYNPDVTNEDWKAKGLTNQEIESIALSMNKCLPEKELVYNENGEENIVTWNFPEGFPEDGKWVEQCLGAMVIAKVRVVLEDNFGKRMVKWIGVDGGNTSFSVGDIFEGRDYTEEDNSNAGKPPITFTESNLTLDPVTKEKTLVLNNVIINKFTIFDNDGIKRAIPQKQVGADAELNFTGVNVKGTWSIVFPK